MCNCGLERVNPLLESASAVGSEAVVKSTSRNPAERIHFDLLLITNSDPVRASVRENLSTLIAYVASCLFCVDFSLILKFN